ncbi:MAG: hypothetical protein ACRDNL_01515 [Spirillospora sp.]
MLGAMAAVIAVSLPFLGFALLSGGLERMGDASALADRGRPTIGIVRDTRTESQGPGTGVKKEVLVRFAVADGTRHSVWSSGDEKVGAAVRLLYDPEDPENASTESVTEQRVSGATRVFGGVLLGPVLLLAYVGFVGRRLLALRHRGTATTVGEHGR